MIAILASNKAEGEKEARDSGLDYKEYHVIVDRESLNGLILKNMITTPRFWSRADAWIIYAAAKDRISELF